LSAIVASSACVSCGVAITTTSTPGCSMTLNAPENASSKPFRSASRIADNPLAEVTATNRSKPAALNAGSRVPAVKLPAPIQPTPGVDFTATGARTVTGLSAVAAAG
jgi:hypothetical protein